MIFVQGGDVCHWNSAGVRRDTVGVADPLSQVTRQPLLENSLDVVGGSLVFGEDTKAFYVMRSPTTL